MRDALCDLRRRFQHVLAAVEDKEDALVAQRVDDRRQQLLAGHLADPEDVCDGWRHRAGIGDDAEVDKPNAVVEVIPAELCARSLDREPRLADAAGAVQRDEATRTDRRRQVAQFALAAEKRG